MLRPIKSFSKRKRKQHPQITQIDADFMIRRICLYSVFSVLAVGIVGCSALQDDCPEHFQLAEDASTEMVRSDVKRHCCVRVTVEPMEDMRGFLLTFAVDPPRDVEPVFYMAEEIWYGVGLKIKKIFPHNDARLMTDIPTPYIDHGKLVKISSGQQLNSHIPYSMFSVFDWREGRAVLFQQHVYLREDLPQEPGLYVVTYEHPWEEIEGGNMHFESNELLISRTTMEKSDQLYNRFKDDMELQLARYKMKHPPVSETPKWQRPLKYFDEYIETGMLYDEIIFLMGSPDWFSHESDTMRWHYETSPNGGFSIDFVDGRVVRKGFSFDSDS